ncbi:MAG: hypothetical protein AB3N16_12655 [Flavobacteriaceae bacterium]
MKRIFWFSCFMFLFGCSGDPATSALTSGGATLILDELNSVIDDAISKAEFAYNKSLNNTAIQIKSLNSDLKYNIESSIDHADQKITKQQFQLLENLIVLNDEFNNTLANNISSTEGLTNTIGQIFSELPFVKNEPRINQFDLPFYVLDWSNRVEIVLKGYNLDHKKNYLSFADTILTPSTKTSTSISFLIDKKHFNQYLKDYSKDELRDIVNVPSNLYLFYKKGFFSTTKEKHFPLNLKILPRIIGRVSVTYQVEEYDDNIEHIVTNSCAVGTPGPGMSGRRKTRSNSCAISAPKRIIENCNMEVQGKIIPGSIKTVVTAKRYGGGHSVNSVTDLGFVLNVTAKSQGKPGGGGGLYAAHAEYDVVYPCKVKKDKATEFKALKIGQDLAYDFTNEKSATFKRIEMKLFDGSEIILNPAKRNHSLFSISSNDPKRELILRPTAISR